MKENIEQFMDHVEIINRDFSRYKNDDKGIIFTLNTVQLLPRIDYLELDKAAYDKAKFENAIDNLEYTTANVSKPTSKYSITKKEEDKFTITSQMVAVRLVWNVVNALGLHKSFTNKEDALKLYEEIYDRVNEKL